MGVNGSNNRNKSLTQNFSLVVGFKFLRSFKTLFLFISRMIINIKYNKADNNNNNKEYFQAVLTNP